MKAASCKRVFDSATEIVEEVLLLQVAPGKLEMPPTDTTRQADIGKAK